MKKLDRTTHVQPPGPHPRKEHVTTQVLAAERAIRALGVDRLALFGPVVRDAADEAGDVDLLVRFQPGRKNIDAFLQLADLLESRIGHPVQLLTTEGLSPHLGPHILAEAQDLLYPPEMLESSS